MKVSLVQTNPQPNRALNLEQTRALMEEACRTEDPDLIVLPEYFEAYGISTTEKLAMAEPAGAAAYRMASDFAREHRVFVHAGTIMEKVEHEPRIWNTSFVFDREDAKSRPIARSTCSTSSRRTARSTGSRTPSSRAGRS